MNEIENIEIDGLKFEIQITIPGDWLNKYPSSVRQLVRVYYVPTDSKLKENQVIRLFNNREAQILNHLRKLLEVRKDQFKDIEINYRFTNTGFNLHRIHGQLFVINLRADLDTKFKND